MALLPRAKDAVYRFFLTPASPRPLGVLRILFTGTLLAQAFFLSSQLFELFGGGGIMQDGLTRYLVQPGVPRLSWFVARFATWGVGEQSVILAAGLVYVVSLTALMLGLFTRPAAIAAWFLHWTLMNSGYCTNYGADVFGHIFLFYFIFLPVGRAYSLDVLLGRASERPSSEARLALRMVQIHLCFVYLAGGVGKAMGAQWWDGDAMWRALMLPVYAQFDMSWLANWPILPKLLGWGTLVVEIGYPIFIWPRLTRKAWVAMTVSLHLGIILFLGLGVFGALMAALTFSAFGIAAEPRTAEEKESRHALGSAPAVPA